MKFHNIDHAAFARAWNAGVSTPKMADALGLSVTTVREYAHLLELPPRRHGGQFKMAAADLAMMWEAGMTGAEIAKRNGYASASAIYKRVRQMGLPRRYKSRYHDAEQT